MELMLQDPPDPSKRGARKGRIICSVEGHPEKKTFNIGKGWNGGINNHESLPFQKRNPI